MPEKHINFNGLGLNLDSANNQVKEGQVTYALNAIIESWDGNRVVYQNEQSNIYHFQFEDGLRPLGVFEISNIDRTVYFLKNDVGRNVIAYSDKAKNTYTILLEGECLGFDFNHPIHQVVVKITNCSVEFYWADNVGMRFINFDDLPWKEIPDPTNDFKKIKLEGQLDCNKLKVQPDFSIPKVETKEVVEGGTITEGSYQFTVCYGNSLGEIYSPFFNVTNPISIRDIDRVTPDFNLPTSKAIRVKVENLDTSGVYDYFNLVVLENINGITTPKLVGTYPIASESYDILYTGQVQTNQSIQLSLEQIFQKYQYYDLADGVTTSDDRVIWYGLTEKERINYQSVASKIPLYWETVKIPYDNTNGYSSAINTEKYKGYPRGEVFPFEIVFLLTGGKQTDKFSLRNFSTGASKIFEDFSIEDYGVAERGTFDAWQSTERYPNNTDIWGSWSGEFIQHFKFPEENLTTRFRVIDGKTYIFPLGIKILKNDILKAIDESDLTDDQKQEIIGFKIVRGDRASGNMSIVAKGHFTNVGHYRYQEQDYYFPNYPYNDVGIDPLFANSEVKPLSGYNPSLASTPFSDKNPKDSLTFHSPDTHFTQPFGIDSGYVQIEGVDYGKMKGHFTKIKNNAQYKFPTQTTVKVSAALAAAIAFDYTKRKGIPTFNGTDAIAVFDSTQELFKKLTPYTNFGYNINSIAKFDNSIVLDEPIKQDIIFGKYLVPGYHSDKDGNTINNFQRESSVFLTLKEAIPFAHDLAPEVPKDNSRITSIEAIENNSMSYEDFFYLVKGTEGDTNLLLSVISAIQGVAIDLAGGSENLASVLLSILTRLFSRQIQIKSAEDFKALNDTDTTCTGSSTEIFELAPSEVDNPCWSDDSCVGKGVIQRTVLLSSSWEMAPIFRIPDWSGTTIGDGEIIELELFKDEYSVADSLEDWVVSTIGSANPEEEKDVDDLRASRDVMAKVDTDYGKITYSVCGGQLIKSLYTIIETAKEIYESIGEINYGLKDLSKIRERDVNAYYGSIRKVFPNQWGRVHSYEIVDTGFYGDLQKDEDFPTIFGGDTYINSFSFKTKLPVFKQGTVATPDQSDISLDEEGNLGNPMFWISTKPFSDKAFTIDDSSLSSAFSGIGLINRKAVIGGIMQNVGALIGSSAAAIAGVLLATTGWTGVGAVAAAAVAVVGWIISGIGALFANKRSAIEKAAITVYRQLFQQVIDRLGIKNINLDRASKRGIGHDGIFYQYVYGIPTYFVESQVNVDYRQATNEDEGNYYPRVGTGIPDDWLQEARVSINWDNIYHYNKTFSKQNKENFYSALREDYDYTKPCFNVYPNRAIWSDKTTLNETLNNWLIYKPLNKFDFPKEFGKLTALNGLLNRQIVARFEDRTQLYNAMTTLQSDQGSKVYIGSSDLFAQPPLDITDVDGGSMGSQHKMFLKTEYGAVSIDAKRGQILLMQGTNPKILTDDGTQKWFAKYLPFEIVKYFPEVNTDNHFSGIGLHGVYDKFYKRLIVTKRDRKLKEGVDLEDLVFEGGKWISKKKIQELIKKNEIDNWKYFKREGSILHFERIATKRVLPKNTDIHAYFDRSSMSFYDARDAKNALERWFETLKRANPDYEGNLYTIIIVSDKSDANIGYLDVEAAVERWLRGIKYSTEGTKAVTSRTAWASLNNLPPNFTEDSYVHPDNLIILSFIDEAETKVTTTCHTAGMCGYHGAVFPSFGEEGASRNPKQPTIAYRDDFAEFKNHYHKYTTFQQVLYPINRLEQPVFNANVLQMVAAVQGRKLTATEISEIRSSADISILQRENPYTEGLKEYNVKGIFDKTSPASEVFSASTFGSELTSILDLGRTEYTREEKIVPVPEVNIDDYFTDYSWTMSYSFITRSWVGWHSYLPDVYVGYDNYFQTIVNGKTYEHSKTYNSFCEFYGKQEPYIIEYPFVYKQLDEIVQSITDRSNSFRYTDYDIVHEPNEILYYNKAWVYNTRQNSGLLNLIPRPERDLSAYLKYPKYNEDSKDVLIDRKDGMISFNSFWDITKDQEQPTFKYSEYNIGKVFNETNLDYSPRHFRKDKIRSNNVKVRLIRDIPTDFKLTSQFITTDNQTSII